MSTNGSTPRFGSDSSTLELEVDPILWQEFFGELSFFHQGLTEPCINGTEACIAQQPSSEMNVKLESECDISKLKQGKRQKTSTCQVLQIKTLAEQISDLEAAIMTLTNQWKEVKIDKNLRGEEKKLAANRISAALSRRKRDIKLLKSQDHIGNLERENAALKRENAELKALVATLQNSEQSTSVRVTIPETSLLFQFQNPSPKSSPVKKQQEKQTRQYFPT